MRKIVSIVLLATALVAALVWGNVQQRQRAQLAQNVENQYMQSYHNLSWTSENLTDSLGQLQVSGSLQRQQRILADIRVHATHGVDSLAGLPLIYAPLQHTQAYLSDLSQVADQYAQQVSQGKALSADQMTYVADLQKRSGQMEGELHDLTGLLDGGRIRWSDVAGATTAKQDGTAQTPLLQTLTGMDKSMAPTPAASKAPGVQVDRQTALLNAEAQVQPAYAIDQVRKFMDTGLKAGPTITSTQNPNDKDLPIPMFIMDATKSTGTKVQVGVSMRGGHVIYVLDGRPLGKAGLSRSQAESRAMALLQRLGYSTVKEIDYDQPDGQALITFVPLQGSTLLMPDAIEVTVALDNGEILGFNAKNYWLNHHTRTLPAPKLSDADARARLAKGAKVLEVNPAIFVNDARQEVNTYCYTVQTGTGDQYRVFINNQTGVEEGIQRLVSRPGKDR